MKNSRQTVYLILSFLFLLQMCEINDLKVETGEVSDILPTTARITGYSQCGRRDKKIRALLFKEP